MRPKYFIVGLTILGPSMPPLVEIKVRSVIVRVGLTLTVTVSTFISTGGDSNYATGRVRVQESFYPDNSPPFSRPHHTSSWSPERASITQRFLMAKSTGGIPAITVTAASNMIPNPDGEFFRHRVNQALDAFGFLHCPSPHHIRASTTSVQCYKCLTLALGSMRLGKRHPSGRHLALGVICSQNDTLLEPIQGEPQIFQFEIHFDANWSHVDMRDDPQLCFSNN